MQKTTLTLDKRLAKKIAIFTVPVVLFITLISIGFAGEGSQQFSLLANSFLHGHTYFLKTIGGVGQDPVNYHGHIYWDEGPFPAVVLMPFVAFFNIWHIFFYQGYIKWLLILAICYLLFKLARKVGFNVPDSLIWMFGFILGSVFIGVGSVSSGWLFAQIVGTLLALWSLYEYMNKRRWWLIGLLVALLFMTRAPAAVIILFYLIVILRSKVNWSIKRKHLAQLFIFIFAAILITGVYNYQRFGNPLNNGNQYQLQAAASDEARSLGLFSLIHVPTNLYTMVLRAPSPVLRTNTSWSLKFPYIDNNPLGVSIFITSPWLLYVFTKGWKKYPKEAKYLLIATAGIALVVLSYFGDGADQLGYRYSLDFMPTLVLAIMLIYRRNTGNLSRGMKLLLLGSGLTNFWLLASYVH